MSLTVRFSTPMTLAVPQSGLGIFTDSLVALGNGGLVDILPMSTFNGTVWSASETLVSLDALDPARMAKVALPAIGGISLASS